MARGGASDGVGRSLRRSGLRATAPRVAVLRVLRTAERPLSHSEVVERLEVPVHDGATVYRNLNDLVEVGLATRMDLGDHVWRFEARPRAGEPARHPHALCTCCGTIRCLGSRELPEAQETLPPGWTDLDAAVFHGQCEECS